MTWTNFALLNHTFDYPLLDRETANALRDGSRRRDAYLLAYQMHTFNLVPANEAVRVVGFSAHRGHTIMRCVKRLIKFYREGVTPRKGVHPGPARLTETRLAELQAK